MKKKTTLESFRLWLEKKTNSYAESCSSYTRVNGEVPPDSLTYPYQIYREVWDSFCVIVQFNSAYRPSRTLATFLEDYASLDMTSAELFGLYIGNTLPTVYGYTDEHVKTLNRVIKKFGGVEDDH